MCWSRRRNPDSSSVGSVSSTPRFCRTRANLNISGSTWQNYEIRHDDKLGVVNVSFLRTRRAYSRQGVARVQGTAEGVGRLPRSPSTDILEEGACPRPHALFNGPSVIPLAKRALDILPFARGEYPSYGTTPRYGPFTSPLRFATPRLLTLDLVLCWPFQDSRVVLFTPCDATVDWRDEECKRFVVLFFIVDILLCDHPPRPPTRSALLCSALSTFSPRFLFQLDFHLTSFHLIRSAPRIHIIHSINPITFSHSVVAAWPRTIRCAHSVRASISSSKEV
jgi:hypothetical protein